jgi:hypothetical protein
MRAPLCVLSSAAARCNHASGPCQRSQCIRMQVAALLGDASRQRGVFQCQVAFGHGAGAYEFQPSRAALEAALDSNTAAMVQVRSRQTRPDGLTRSSLRLA